MSQHKNAPKPDQIWQGLMTHVSRGEEAEKLLREVGPYGGEVERHGKLILKLQKFFDFDDSE